MAFSRCIVLTAVCLLYSGIYAAPLPGPDARVTTSSEALVGDFNGQLRDIGNSDEGHMNKSVQDSRFTQDTNAIAQVPQNQDDTLTATTDKDTFILAQDPSPTINNAPNSNAAKLVTFPPNNAATPGKAGVSSGSDQSSATSQRPPSSAVPASSINPAKVTPSQPPAKATPSNAPAKVTPQPSKLPANVTSPAMMANASQSVQPQTPTAVTSQPPPSSSEKPAGTPVQPQTPTAVTSQPPPSSSEKSAGTDREFLAPVQPQTPTAVTSQPPPSSSEKSAGKGCSEGRTAATDLIVRLKLAPIEEVYIPLCDEKDGTKYKAKQCHQLTKYCWCVDPASGSKIPQSVRKPKEGEPDCENHKNNNNNNNDNNGNKSSEQNQNKKPTNPISNSSENNNNNKNSGNSNNNNNNRTPPIVG